ncbi:MAG: type II toxin-antitoxin system PemK/MazF family toxin [Gammaproteobacteria bacterium]|nr:type II toxin-antitoxin system PemK/MazF family toxin [Gammaproteobacteria bacterium]
MYTPDRGDIVYLDFDPSAGKEITKRRPALVLSRRLFNKHTNLAIVAPITSTIRGVAIEVLLPKGMEIAGAVLVAQMRSIDYAERSMVFVESTSESIIDECQKKAVLILS